MGLEFRIFLIIVNIFFYKIKEILFRKEEVLIKSEEIETQIMLPGMLVHLIIITLFTELETCPLRKTGLTDPVTVLYVDTAAVTYLLIVMLLLNLMKFKEIKSKTIKVILSFFVFLRL